MIVHMTTMPIAAVIATVMIGHISAVNVPVTTILITAVIATVTTMPIAAVIATVMISLIIVIF
jgi:hypothetical protein